MIDVSNTIELDAVDEWYRELDRLTVRYWDAYFDSERLENEPTDDIDVLEKTLKEKLYKIREREYKMYRNEWYKWCKNSAPLTYLFLTSLPQETNPNVFFTYMWEIPISPYITSEQIEALIKELEDEIQNTSPEI